MSALPPDEAHLWLLPSDGAAATDEALLARARGFLAPEEAARLAAYRFPRGRREYLLTRALCRSVLSRYAPVAPGAWRFRPNAHGRPEVAGPDGAPPLRFNLANTAGLIACLVGGAREVGVDVEAMDRRTHALAVAERFFSAAEAAALRALPQEAQRARFLEYWTLKESYIKARGLGLALPLGDCTFVLDAGRPPRVELLPRLGDDAAAWQFFQLRPTERHLAAAAVRRGDGPEVRLVARALTLDLIYE